MGVTSKTVIKIVCDNPSCPGNDLDPKSYDGWIRVNITTQHAPPTLTPLPAGAPAPMAIPYSSGEQIFCSSTCAGSIQTKIDEAEAARAEAEAAAEAAREAWKNAPKGDVSLPTPEA